MKTERTVYVQKRGKWYYSESDWDGDWFTGDILHAEKRSEPWEDGRGTVTYNCVKVKIIEDIEEEHEEGQVYRTLARTERYRVRCPRCGRQTKDYATRENALASYKKMQSESRCIVTTCIEEEVQR